MSFLFFGSGTDGAKGRFAIDQQFKVMCSIFIRNIRKIERVILLGKGKCDQTAQE